MTIKKIKSLFKIIINKSHKKLKTKVLFLLLLNVVK